MRFVFCIIFCTISTSVSAQWWKFSFLSPKKPPERPDAIVPLADHSFSRLPVAIVITQQINAFQLSRSSYSYKLAEDLAIKAAQHNMSLGVYYDASYNFSELARLYMQQNRFSEAKWYLLQSNNISRRQNDVRHTVSNLIDLAMVKANTSNDVQALEDLQEAREIAKANHFIPQKEAALALP